MKKTFSFIVIMIMAFGCKAQTIVPIEEFWSFAKTVSEGEERPRNIYFKDVNYVLDKYVGVWDGHYEDKDYKLVINKLKGLTTSTDLSYDILIVRYEIKTEKNNVLASTLNEKNDLSNKIINGLKFDRLNNNLYELFYTGLDDNDVFCGDKGTIYLDIAQDGKTMQLFIIPSEALISEEECPKGGINPPFPDETERPMILTKKQ